MPLIDKPNTDFAEKAWENMTTIRLYDPPVNGRTPGTDFPYSSEIVLRDKDAKLAQGFSTEVIGWDGEYPTLGDYPVRPGTQFAPEPIDDEEVTGTVTGKATRKRTIQR